MFQAPVDHRTEGPYVPLSPVAATGSRVEGRRRGGGRHGVERRALLLELPPDGAQNDPKRGDGIALPRFPSRGTCTATAATNVIIIVVVVVVTTALRIRRLQSVVVVVLIGRLDQPPQHLPELEDPPPPRDIVVAADAQHGEREPVCHDDGDDEAPVVGAAEPAEGARRQRRDVVEDGAHDVSRAQEALCGDGLD